MDIDRDSHLHPHNIHYVSSHFVPLCSFWGACSVVPHVSMS